MKKIIRILGLILVIKQKKNYSKRIRRELVSRLLYLEYKSYTVKENEKEIVFKLFDYQIYAYNYENLRILFTEIFVHEEYQYFTGLEEGTVIADCGANIGMASLYFKWRFPGCVIHAFEPDPMAFAALTRNMQSNRLQNVYLHNVAVMAEEGSLEFYVSSSEEASLMMSTLPKRMNEKRIEVQGIDFSGFVDQNKPSILKIDIEGAERTVLDKLSSTNSLQHFKQIIMEYHHKIEGHPSGLSGMLLLFERNGFEYNLITHFNTPGKFQDILIYAYRPVQLRVIK